MSPTNTLPKVEELSITQNRDEPESTSSSGFVTPLTEPSQAATLASTATSSLTSTEGADYSQENPTGHICTPFVKPLPESQPVARPSLTADQIAKYANVHKAVSGWSTIPTSGVKNAGSASLSEDERMWLTRECILRYLRASSWHTQNAIKRLQETLVWRREYGLEDITAEHVSVEGETGKQHILGFDNNARPCLYMSPGRQNTEKSERQIKHLVFMLERVIDLMPPGQETTALLINFKGATSGGSPSLNQGKQVLYILQSHYPERLGRACISDLPWYINTFFKLVSPFIDPVTKEKMIFNQDLRKYIPPVQLDKEFGGDADFEYNHEIYWPALDRMCAKRRSIAKERWVKGGKHIGEYEGYLRGGSQPSFTELAKKDIATIGAEDASAAVGKHG